MRLSHTLKATAEGERSVKLVREFAAPPSLVFEAFTSPRLLPRWLTGPEGWVMAICEVDLKVGGSYRFGLENADGRTMEMLGAYHEIAPGERLVTSERMPPFPGEAEIVAVFEEIDGGRTRYTAIETYPTPQARDGALGVMMPGVSASYDRLDVIFAEAVQNAG